MPSTNNQTFEEQVLAAFRELRTALVEVFESAQVDVNRAFPAARELQVNKNLTWKASKIIRATSPLEAIDYLPGKAGMKLLLTALANHGAPPPAIERTELAVDEFDRVIEAHASHRETLELMLDGLTEGDSVSDNLEKSRRLAFLGNSGIWGIQAEARLITYILTPGDGGKGSFDLAFLVGFVQLKRLRIDAPWTIAHSRSFGADGSVRVDKRRMPIFPTSSDFKDAPIIAEHTTPGTPIMVVSEQNGSLRIELPEGPAGNQGAINIYLGYISRNYANLFADEQNVIGRLIHETNCPIRTGLVDVLVHEDLPQVGPFEYQLFRRRDHDDRLVPTTDARIALPIQTRPVALDQGSAALETPCYERYSELIRQVAEHLGTDAGKFRGHRIQIDYPPMGTTGLFSFPLISNEVNATQPQSSDSALDRASSVSASTHGTRRPTSRAALSSAMSALGSRPAKLLRMRVANKA